MAVSAVVLTYAAAVVNNDAPVITSAASVSVVENQTAVLTVTATDADGDTPTFSLSGVADVGLFAINSTTGVLTLTSAPDFENPLDANTDNNYLITVTVNDGANTDSQDLTVTVNDVNEDPVGAVSDTDAAANDVAENAANGAVVGITASATDPDGTDTESYTLDNDAVPAIVAGRGR